MIEHISENDVSVNRATNPSVIAYSPVFNVAAVMIDRHLNQGRGNCPAIINADAGPGTEARNPITYQQLADRVNRCGNLLHSLVFL